SGEQNAALRKSGGGIRLVRQFEHERLVQDQSGVSTVSGDRTFVEPQGGGEIAPHGVQIAEPRPAACVVAAEHPGEERLCVVHLALESSLDCKVALPLSGARIRIYCPSLRERRRVGE